MGKGQIRRQASPQRHQSNLPLSSKGNFLPKSSIGTGLVQVMVLLMILMAVYSLLPLRE